MDYCFCALLTNLLVKMFRSRKFFTPAIGLWSSIAVYRPILNGIYFVLNPLKITWRKREKERYMFNFQYCYSKFRPFITSSPLYAYLWIVSWSRADRFKFHLQSSNSKKPTSYFIVKPLWQWISIWNWPNYIKMTWRKLNIANNKLNNGDRKSTQNTVVNAVIL